jgi:FG-GAP-like repeat/FG-GAP repeat
MWLYTLEKEETEKTEKTTSAFSLLPPVRIALAALVLLAFATPAQPGFQAPLAFDVGSNPLFVAVGDFNRDGIADLVVANNDSNNVSVLLGKGDGTFGAAVNYAAGPGPQAVAVADLNGDGIPDLAVASTGGVRVLLGIGDGTFQAAVKYTAAGALHGVVVADFNGDGKPDLAVANSAKGVSVLLGNGDGSFQAAVDFPAGAAAISLAIGDFNRDGIPDLVVANNTASGTVSVLLGNGDGTFQAAVKYAVGNGPSAVTLADLNGDGVLDLAVANAGSNKVSVLLGNGDGTFQAAKSFAAGPSPPSSVAAGDFNGDGIVDLVVANSLNSSGQGGSVAVLLGNGDGTFQEAVNYAAGVSANFVAVGDFNGDGKADLAVTNAGQQGNGNNVSVLLGKGDGTFQAAPTFSAGTLPSGVAVGDFNGDGISDLAVANLGGFAVGTGQGSVSILLGNGDGSFRATAEYDLGRNCVSVAVADFNGDGISDLVVCNWGSNTVSVLLGNGDGTFQPAIAYPAGEYPLNASVADINGDGIPDLIVVNEGDPFNNGQGAGVAVLLGHGDGTFQAAKKYALMPYVASVAVGDFNHDGIPDLVVTMADFNTGQGGSVGVLLGNGDGTFQAAVHYAAHSGPISVAVADLNGDGIPDLAVANVFSNDLSVLLGKGDGTFQAAVNYLVGPFPQFISASKSCLAVKDFNGDGIPDLAVLCAGGVRVLLGNGDGTFQTTAISYVAGPDAVVVGDFNGDGLPDLAVCIAGLNQVSILLNDGKWTP